MLPSHVCFSSLGRRLLLTAAVTVLGCHPAQAQSSPPPPAEASQDAQLPDYLQADRAPGASVPDPWERYNRHVFRFNKRVDQWLARPLAQAYQRAVPSPARRGVSNFFENLHEPLSAFHLVLQGHVAAGGKSATRFLVNTTVGLGGLFDPASRMQLPATDEDGGQTLARWGWVRSRYFLVPFLGPGTVRDRVGALADVSLSPFAVFEHDRTRLGLHGLSLIDTRQRLLPLDAIDNGIDDDYVLVREAWAQRRQFELQAPPP